MHTVSSWDCRCIAAVIESQGRPHLGISTGWRGGQTGCARALVVLQANTLIYVTHRVVLTWGFSEVLGCRWVRPGADNMVSSSSYFFFEGAGSISRLGLPQLSGFTVVLC